MCLHASNSPLSYIYSSVDPKANSKSLSHNISPITFKFRNFDSKDGQYEPLSRKFASGSKIHDLNDTRFLITCGSAQSRLNSTVALSNNPFELKINQNEASPLPASRQCHSCCSINSSLYLFGGRTSPGRSLPDAWKLSMNTTRSFDWIQLEDMPVSRSKHSSVAISDTEILVVGGLSTDDTVNLFSIYSTITNTWTPLHINIIKNRGTRNILIEDLNLNSFSLIYNQTNQIGSLIGGMKLGVPGSNEISDTVYNFSIDLQSNQVDIWIHLKDELVARYGSRAVLLPAVGRLQDTILIVGGVSLKSLTSQTTVVQISQTESEVLLVPFDSPESWSESPLFVGFDLFVDEEDGSIWIVGGGAVCYLFGSKWNQLSCISLEKDMDSPLLILCPQC
ncbi:unnamed protein product [Ambrosiozyma monospora]|uniref:Unnamed protein product n=1 Tax=Ambrosiozyma monospora TaxID=43982 RepID=A0A9W7DED7_AMBMO|nr:unnamed protein product [Ambrosiozyma monospora]